VYKILIVDDEQLERNALKVIINKDINSIVEIEEAVNGREAIVKSRSFNPDIIFLDIKMPGINGIDAARTIRDSDSSVSIVFLTAYNQFEYAREAIDIGVSNFIIKPSSDSHILEVINKVITNIDNSRAEFIEKEDNEIRLNKASGYLENEFIYNLSVRGISEEKFESYLSFLELDFFSARAGISKLNYSTYPVHIDSSYQKHVLRKKTVFIIQNILTDIGLTTLFNMELSNIYFLVIKLKGSSINLDTLDISRLSIAISDEVKKTINLEVITSFGSIFKDPAESIKSFSRAKNNLVGEASLLSAVQQPSKADIFPFNLEIELEQGLLKGSRKEVLETYQHLCNWFNNSLLKYENKKRSIIELTTVLRHAVAYQQPDGICTVDDGDINEAMSAEVLLSGLNIFLNNLLEQTASVKNMENSPAIKSACRFIEDNFKQDITLEESATHCRLSSFYFSKLFKKSMGITFIDYLTNCRLREAKRLLESSNLSMKEISYEIGYSDPNYFTRVFKRIESISPTTYRSNKMLRSQ